VRELTGFSQELRSEVKAIWERIFTHPFLVELSEGKLPISKFRFYIKQDHTYVREYNRFLGLAIAKASTLELMKWLMNLMVFGFTMELEMQKRLIRKIGLTQTEVSSTELAPTATAYISYLIQVASVGSIGEIVAAMAPCTLTFVEIGRRMVKSKGLDKEPVYKEWCSFYASPEAEEAERQFIELLDTLAEKATQEERNRMKRHFVTASRYEYMFWDMAYRRESWPI
jgi:thiaminase/transcriptional activator TenA